MAIYAEEYQRQPNESFYDYLMRINQLRASGMLGNYRETQDSLAAVNKTGRTPEGASGTGLGTTVLRPLTDAQMAAQARRESGMSESERDAMVVRDTPEAQAARRNKAMNEQIKIALGMGITDPADVTSLADQVKPGAGLLMGGLKALANMYEKDVAALALGKALGIEDTQRAKELGYTYLDNPVQLKSLIDSGRITLEPEKPKKSMVASLFGLDLNEEPAPVYQSLAEMRKAEVAPIANIINSSGGLFQDTQDNDGSSIGYVPPSQQPTTSPGAGRGGFNPTVVQSSDSGSSPSGGGTPLSEVGGTVESIANANQDAAYEAMGGFYS